MRILRWIGLILFLLFLTPFFWGMGKISVAAYKNYNQICLSENRRLTHDEMLERIVAKTISEKYAFVSYKDWSRSKRYPVIPYKNAEDFKKQNPKCCQLDPPFAMEIGGDDLYGKLAGLEWHRIRMEYVIRYKDDSGAEKLADAFTESSVTNCGLLMQYVVAGAARENNDKNMQK